MNKQLSMDLQLNGENYKKDSQEYEKLKKRLVMNLDTETLIKELKRRKIIHMNWDSMKYDFKFKNEK